MTNKELIEKYPFLKFKGDNYYADEESLNWLDEMDPGWRKNFGLPLCEDLNKAIAKDGCEDTFEIIQIKEKYGELRIYAEGYLFGGEVSRVLFEYENLSRHICGACGNEAKYTTKGYIYPLCEKCAKDMPPEALKLIKKGELNE